MGQRHQIFARGYVGMGSKKEDKRHIVAFHHQWLYGTNAIAQLRNSLEFFLNEEKNNTKQYSIRNPKNYYHENKFEQCVETSYSMNIRNGYFYQMHNLNKNREENPNWVLPDYQDNNDGQTIIDFTSKGKIEVGFVFPHDTEMFPHNREYDEEDDTNNKYIKVKKWEIFSPREYFELYYDLNDVSDDYKDLIKETLKNIRWIERNTKILKPETFVNMFPHLNKEVDMFKARCKEYSR